MIEFIANRLPILRHFRFIKRIVSVVPIVVFVAFSKKLQKQRGINMPILKKRRGILRSSTQVLLESEKWDAFNP